MRYFRYEARKVSNQVVGRVGYFTKYKAEYSLRESVSAQGREGRGFDSDPGRNNN
jgi:hypothetical protein